MTLSKTVIGKCGENGGHGSVVAKCTSGVDHLADETVRNGHRKHNFLRTGLSITNLHRHGRKVIL